MGCCGSNISIAENNENYWDLIKEIDDYDTEQNNNIEKDIFLKIYTLMKHEDFNKFIQRNEEGVD